MKCANETWSLELNRIPKPYNDTQNTMSMYNVHRTIPEPKCEVRVGLLITRYGVARVRHTIYRSAGSSSVWCTILRKYNVDMMLIIVIDSRVGRVW